MKILKTTSYKKAQIFNSINDSQNNIDDIMRSGLGEWVKDFIKMRRRGNVSGACEIKKNIDREIEKHKLNSRDVYFYYGDPDDPSIRFEVRENIGDESPSLYRY